MSTKVLFVFVENHHRWGRDCRSNVRVVRGGEGRRGVGLGVVAEPETAVGDAYSEVGEALFRASTSC